MGLAVYNSVENAIAGCFGSDVKILDSTGGFGGGINSTKTLSLSNGMKVFVKINTIRNKGFFDAEEEGLWAITDVGGLRTPKLYGKGVDEKLGISFLMMELIETGKAFQETWFQMGKDYALMHLADTSGYVQGGRFGFLHDNYIGASPQNNTPKDSWIDFFRECRLEPQIRMAEHRIDPDTIKASVRLMDRLDSLIDEPERPSLLHGDMWGGNHLIDKDGKAVLIDPAAYVGAAEADIAMTEMFSPMHRSFYEGYYSVIPRRDGYEVRREIYNLYHWLNHLNLFGGSHMVPVTRIIKRFS